MNYVVHVCVCVCIYISVDLHVCMYTYSRFICMYVYIAAVCYRALQYAVVCVANRSHTTPTNGAIT